MVNYFKRFGEIDDFRLIKEKKKNRDQKVYGFVLFKYKESLRELEKHDLRHEIKEGVFLECKPTLLREELKEMQLKNTGVKLYTEEEKKLRKKLKKRIRRMKKKRDKLQEMGRDVQEIEGVIRMEELRLKNKEFLNVQVKEEEPKIGSLSIFRKNVTESDQLSQNIQGSDLVKLGKYYQKEYSGVNYLKSQPPIKTNFFKFACHDAVLSRISDKGKEQVGEGKEDQQTKVSSPESSGRENPKVVSGKEEEMPLSGFGYMRNIAPVTQSEYLLRSNHLLFGSIFEGKNRHQYNTKGFSNIHSDIPKTSDVLSFGQKSAEKSFSSLFAREKESDTDLNLEGNGGLYDSNFLDKPLELEKKRLMDIMEDDINLIDEEDLDDEIDQIELEIKDEGKKCGKDLFSLVGGIDGI